MNLSKNLSRREIKYKIFYKDIGNFYAWLAKISLKKFLRIAK